MTRASNEERSASNGLAKPKLFLVCCTIAPSLDNRACIENMPISMWRVTERPIRNKTLSDAVIFGPIKPDRGTGSISEIVQKTRWMQAGYFVAISEYQGTRAYDRCRSAGIDAG